MIEFQVPRSRFQVGGSRPSQLGTWNLKLGTPLGLTLIEVMLAITILGIGLISLVGAGARCLGVVRQARNREVARHLIAVVELENPLQIEEEIEEGSDSGAFDSPYEGFSWTREIGQAAEDEEDPLFKITTRVTWSEAARGKSVEEVVTYLYAPENQKGGSFESR